MRYFVITYFYNFEKKKFNFELVLTEIKEI